MIFCVIPAYNEEKNIGTVVRAVKTQVDRVVVVDDGSTDKTAEIARLAGATVLRHIINRGQGAALRTGTEYCLKQEAGIIAHFDADGQFLSSDLPKIIALLKAGRAQVVFGSRFLSGAGGKIPLLKRRLIMPLAGAVNKLFFGVNLTDPQSGFRAFTSEAARLVSWRQDRMAHCSEIMSEVKKNKLKVEEAPIEVIYSGFGQNFFGGLRILRDLFIAILLKN